MKIRLKSFLIILFLCSYSIQFVIISDAQGFESTKVHNVNIRIHKSGFDSSQYTNLTVLHINDLHGWLQPHDGYGGCATLSGYFKSEGYSLDNDSFLILSGGDHNTGPAEATLTKGDAVIDVMNSMNFSAAAIGNHEFDFGLDAMIKQQDNATFPVLSCNIYEEGTTNLANFTIPYVVQPHGGINVGIIGLTYFGLHPRDDLYFDIEEYEIALRTYIDDVRTAGADIVIALTHIPPGELMILAEDVADLDIDLFLGGHAGGNMVAMQNNSMIAAANHQIRQYVKIILTVDNDNKTVVYKTGQLKDNIEGGVTPDAEVQAVVDYWVNEVNASQVITYTSQDIYDTHPESGIGNLVTDGFMDYFGWNHNFAFTNKGGGFRDYFRAGDITLGDVVSVIPFENYLFEISITGEQIVDILISHHGGFVYSGIQYNFSENPNFHLTSIMILVDGEYQVLEPYKVYNGLVTDFNWWVHFRGVFPAIDTGVHYRDTVLFYFKKLDDLVNYAYDGRIEESEEGPMIDEYSKIGLSIIFSLIILTIIVKRKKTKTQHRK
jgi:2',3'-cyclic-nucleotide 2'-phosphodiesterase (5'-nucleotidase family)